MSRLRAVLVPALPALILLAPPARGQDCNARLLDMASVVTDAARVEAALEALRPLGIDAHAVTLPDLGGARDLDEAIGRLGASCPSWRSGDARRPDILVIGVALAERQSGLYYGQALDGHAGTCFDGTGGAVIDPPCVRNVVFSPKTNE